jgi:MFS family permease
VTHSGISVCFNTVAEFITMQYIMRSVGKLKAHVQLLLVGGLYLLSTSMMLFIPGILTLYVAFFINGVAYGIMMPARRQFVCENVPDNLLNRMQGIGDMAYTNAGGLISSRLAGGIIDGRGVGALLGLSLTLEAISFAMMTSFSKLRKRADAQ